MQQGDEHPILSQLVAIAAVDIDYSHISANVVSCSEFGRGEKIRTSDFVVPNDALYQAELHPDPGAIIPIYKCAG